jgi:hypothetical protein
MTTPKLALAAAKRAEGRARAAAATAEKRARAAARKVQAAVLRQDRAARAKKLAADRKKGILVWPGPGASILFLQKGQDGLYRPWIQMKPGAMLWPIEHIALPDPKRALVLARAATKPTRRSR